MSKKIVLKTLVLRNGDEHTARWYLKNGVYYAADYTLSIGSELVIKIKRSL